MSLGTQGPNHLSPAYAPVLPVTQAQQSDSTAVCYRTPLSKPHHEGGEAVEGAQKHQRAVSKPALPALPRLMGLDQLRSSEDCLAARCAEQAHEINSLSAS